MSPMFSKRNRICMLAQAIDSDRKVSVIVPVYNTASFLPRCLDSIVSQTYRNLEIICVDDGSTDLSPEILKSYTRKDSRIKVVSQANKGLSGARNTGLDFAAGAYIMFVDSDDYLPPFAVQIFVGVACESQTEVVTSDWLESLSSGKKIEVKNVVKWRLHTVPLRDVFQNLRSFSSVCNKLYRADVLAGRRFIEGISFEDWPFVAVLFGSIQSYASIPMSLYYYDDTGVSIVRSPFSIKKIQSYMVGIRFVYDFYRNRSELDLIRKRLAIAVKMCVNKVYRDKESRALLSSFLHSEIRRLVADRILGWMDLYPKTLFRLWMMR